MSQRNCIVIGSGPSGIACAKALVAGGASVRLIDVGRQLEAGKRDVFDLLAATPQSERPVDLDRQARSTTPTPVHGEPHKAVFGSYYPYALDEPDLRLTLEDADISSSFARGGLSEAWGASMLPYRDVDIANWPLTVADLAPHYRAVLGFVPLAARSDELEASFPLYADQAFPLEQTHQIERVLSHLRGHRHELEHEGIEFGSARLAVRADPEDPKGCRYCGLCMYGCPYGSIYSSSDTLAEMVAHGELEYLSGLHADRVQEDGDRVIVECHEVDRSSSGVRFEADRVFVACGYVSSTRLVLRSSESRPRSVEVADSLYFLTPMLTLHGGPASTATQGNTFAQAYLEVEPDLLQRTVHLQIYGYSDIMLSAMSTQLARHRESSERVLRPVLGRLLAIQGFLHSDDSPRLTMHVEDEDVRFVGHDRPAGLATAHHLVRWLGRRGRMLGMVPIPWMTHVGLPGKSFHTGGTIPMRTNPGSGESDILGRPAGWQRVHVVDSSVLPTIPGTTITLTAMANAHRIAAAALSEP